MIPTLHQGEGAESELLEAVFSEVVHFSQFSPSITLSLLLILLLLIPIVTSLLVLRRHRELKKQRNNLRL